METHSALCSGGSCKGECTAHYRDISESSLSGGVMRVLAMSMTNRGRRSLEAAQRYENAIQEHGKEKIEKATRLAHVTVYPMYSWLNMSEADLDKEIVLHDA